MAKKYDLQTFVAGGVLEVNEIFDVKCNCGGNAPIKPNSTKGYGFSKKGGLTKVVDELETTCLSCNLSIRALVLEGDPGYILTKSPSGTEQLFCPQGSSSTPVADLSSTERDAIIQEIKKQAGQ